MRNKKTINGTKLTAYKYYIFHSIYSIYELYTIQTLQNLKNKYILNGKS